VVAKMKQHAVNSEGRQSSFEVGTPAPAGGEGAVALCGCQDEAACSKQ